LNPPDFPLGFGEWPLMALEVFPFSPPGELRKRGFARIPLFEAQRIAWDTLPLGNLLLGWLLQNVKG